MSKDSPLLIEAKKYIPDCDWIVDLYDLMFQWASPYALKATGYTMEEVLKLRNIDVIADIDEMQLRKEVLGRIGKGHGEVEYTLKDKNNIHYQFKGRYHVFTFDGTWYLVGKILELQKL